MRGERVCPTQKYIWGIGQGSLQFQKGQCGDPGGHPKVPGRRPESARFAHLRQAFGRDLADSRYGLAELRPSGAAGLMAMESSKRKNARTTGALPQPAQVW
jgi:hypothetical protein